MHIIDAEINSALRINIKCIRTCRFERLPDLGFKRLPELVPGPQKSITFKFMKKGGSVYILTNISNNVLYIGVTANLLTRVYEHKTGKYPQAFTLRYHCTKLVYYKGFHTIGEAIAREKQLKNWRRQWKLNLINDFNPQWKDLLDSIE